MRLFVEDPVRKISPLYDEACRKIDPIIAQIYSTCSAQEGFGDNFITKAIIAVFDTLFGVAASLTTNLTKITKKLKRSEMREFYQSNLLKCNSLSNNLKNWWDQPKVMSLKLNAPAGLNISMMDAVASLELIYNQLDAITTAKATLSTLQNVFQAFTNSGMDATPILTDSAKFVQNIVKTSKPSVLKCQKDYRSTKIDNFKYVDLYKDENGVPVTTQSLLNLEPRLQEVHNLVELIKQIEDVLKGLIRLVKEGEGAKIISRDIVTLGEVAKGISLIFDSFALAATRQMSLEHNHILNINALYKAMS